MVECRVLERRLRPCAAPSALEVTVGSRWRTRCVLGHSRGSERSHDRAKDPPTATAWRYSGVSTWPKFTLSGLDCGKQLLDSRCRNQLSRPKRLQTPGYNA